MITSFEGLLEQHASAALRVSGADQSSWSGEIVEAGEGILGLAHWDGTLHLDREFILDPLRELYARAGEPRGDAELLRYREALVTLLHEQSHFLGPAGATQKAARTAFSLPGGRALEEGVAEAWAHDHLNEYLRDLEIDKVAPGILDVRCEPSYAAFVPAVRLLTTDLDQQAAAPPGEALHLLNRQTAEGQWHQVVARIYHSSRLPHLVPAAEAPAIRLHLEQALRASFKGLELYEPLPRGFAASRSHAATTRMISLLHQEVAVTERRYTPAPRSPRVQLTFPPPPKPLDASAPSPPLATPPQLSSEPQRSTPPRLSSKPELLTPPRVSSESQFSTPPQVLSEPPSCTPPQASTPSPASPSPAATVTPINSPHLALHHAFAGLTPPTASISAPPNAPPSPTPPAGSAKQRDL
ncbi:hypothetical protein [Kribbella sp. CA-293567]|uniref:hypothetical protein n=1 Tax=Kribbella sp. CA-293567 TaxID=3002436 RepID=UPI0022DE0EAA|nr:hypothetical protein [Kribbella sp. CA-293567]WBQ05560.1 hypothetical protein OX958_01895 [Kribbella sp. CA-293567]